MSNPNYEDIFNHYIDELNAQQSDAQQACSHTNLYVFRGKHICTECSHEVENFMSEDKDWKDLFSNNKTFYSQRKSSYQSVFDNIVGSHLFDNMTIDSANLLFSKIYDNSNPRKLKRGNSRKCVAFASIYYACIMHGHPYTMDELCNLLNVARKQATTGIKFFTFHIPDDMRHILKSEDDIYTLKQLMRDHHIPDSEQRMVEHLYSYIKLHTNICARSRSRSIILTILLIVYEFTQDIFDKKTYIDRVKMSELTISKIYKVVKEIITCDEDLLKQLNQIKTLDSKYTPSIVESDDGVFKDTPNASKETSNDTSAV